jgi:hypothetical protein
MGITLSRLRVQDQANNQASRRVSLRILGVSGYHLPQYLPIQTQNFAENQNQNHADVNA